jgi:hypothetical protein
VSGINRIIMSLHTIADVLYAPKRIISRCKLQKTGFSVLCTENVASVLMRLMLPTPNIVHYTLKPVFRDLHCETNYLGVSKKNRRLYAMYAMRCDAMRCMRNALHAETHFLQFPL